MVGAILKMISKDVATAMASGTFFAEDNSTSAVRRWRSTGGLARNLRAPQPHHEELFDIEERVADRRDGGEPTPIQAKVEILQFRSLPGA